MSRCQINDPDDTPCPQRGEASLALGGTIGTIRVCLFHYARAWSLALRALTPRPAPAADDESTHQT